MKKVFSLIKFILVIVLITSPIVVPIALKIHNEAVEKHLYDLRDMQKKSKLSKDLRDRAKDLIKVDLDNVKIFLVDSRALDDFHKKVDNNGDRDAFTIYPSNCKVNCNYEIYISDNMESEDQDALMAHEILHVIYHSNNLSKDIRLSDELKKIYDNNSELQKSLRTYNPESYIEESFSYLCTEHSDSKLTKYVLESCNKYINRDNLKLLY